MKRFKFVAVLLAALSLVSCAGSNGENADGEQIEMVKIENVVEDIDGYREKVKNLKLDNLTVSEDFTLEVPTTVKTGKYIVPDHFEDNYEKIFSHYDSDYSEEYVDSAEGYYPTGPDYLNEEKDIFCSVGCTGFVNFMKGMNSDGLFYNRDYLVTTYSSAQAKDRGETFEMLDGSELAVSEAYEMAVSFADDFVKTADYKNDLRLQRITVYQAEDKYFYLVDFAHVVNGVPVISYNNTGESDKETIVSSVEMVIAGTDKYYFISQGVFEDYEINGELAEIFDPEDAVSYVSRTLVERMNLQVRRVALEYRFIAEGNIEEMVEDELTHAELSGGKATSYTSYNVFSAEPCWVIYFDETKDKEVYAVLSCEDKSVEFVNNVRG